MKAAYPFVVPTTREDYRNSGTDLMDRVRSKDIEALGIVYARYYKLVYSIMRDRLNSVEDAREATQDLFISLFSRNLSHIEGGDKGVKDYISGAARKAAIDHIRKPIHRDSGFNPKNFPLETILTEDGQVISGEHALFAEYTEGRIPAIYFRRVLLEHVEPAIESIQNEDRRRALVWRHIYGLSIREIIEREKERSGRELKTNTVQVQVFRGKRDVRKYYVELFGPEILSEMCALVL
tara:strand:- start:932 stop:1642 length:711 start_codon:yes stop_codon:yes gene_type:complete